MVLAFKMEKQVVMSELLPSTQEGLLRVVPATFPGRHEHLTVCERSSMRFLLQHRWAAITSHVPPSAQKHTRTQKISTHIKHISLHAKCSTEALNHAFKTDTHSDHLWDENWRVLTTDRARGRVWYWYESCDIRRLRLKVQNISRQCKYTVVWSFIYIIYRMYRFKKIKSIHLWN